MFLLSESKAGRRAASATTVTGNGHTLILFLTTPGFHRIHVSREFPIGGPHICPQFKVSLLLGDFRSGTMGTLFPPGWKDPDPSQCTPRIAKVFRTSGAVNLGARHESSESCMAATKRQVSSVHSGSERLEEHWMPHVCKLGPVHVGRLGGIGGAQEMSNGWLH